MPLRSAFRECITKCRVGESEDTLYTNSPGKIGCTLDMMIMREKNWLIVQRAFCLHSCVNKDKIFIDK